MLNSCRSGTSSGRNRGRFIRNLSKLARAARHEERLDNPSAGESLENIAESIEETALNELPEAAQSLENQALANELEDLAESARGISRRSGF